MQDRRKRELLKKAHLGPKPGERRGRRTNEIRGRTANQKGVGAKI